MTYTDGNGMVLFEVELDVVIVQCSDGLAPGDDKVGIKFDRGRDLRTANLSSSKSRYIFCSSKQYLSPRRLGRSHVQCGLVCKTRV